MEGSSIDESSSLDFPVVTLGASAGGIGPVDAFFEALPERPGMAFVVILHLAPGRSSQLADVVAAHTELPTRQVTGETPVEINHVYVIPPGQNLSIREGRLHLSDIEKSSRQRMPIDHFMRSLARDQGPKAAGIIFSGTGNDGTLGLERIKEAGGLTLVQTPASSEHTGMPSSAIRTGIVDAALPAGQLGRKLVDYFRRRGPGAVAPKPEDLSEEDDRALDEILAAVRSATDHDFSQYKRSTVLRRIGRRLQISGAESLPAYRDLVQERPEEARKLAKEFLISVTQFFREPQAFAVLEETVLPELLAGREDEVRVWVPGCATGEEVYSVAMGLLEQAERLESSSEIQLFATDIDTEALGVARRGVYPRSIAEDLPGGRLERFFREEEAGYAVTSEVRNLVTFAEHNLLRDPPFSHLDLITCRNLLIYLNRQVQEKVFELFHYALRPEGYLLLGTSESAEGVSDLFSAVDKQASIYRRWAVDSSRLEVPGLPLMDPGAGRPWGANDQEVSDTRGFSALHQQLSAHRLAPPSAIIDEDYNVVHLAGGFGRYLRESDGKPSRNLLEKLPAGIHASVRQALGEAARGENSRQVRRIRHAEGGQIRALRLTVEALDDPEGFFLVALDPIGAAPSGETGTEGKETAGKEERDPALEELEEELRRTQEELRRTVEDYETSIEELKSSNEELQSMNEELQSTTEELKTSKEEHQSINEELSTVNDELSHKIDELSRANSDLKNLMEATEIGIIFVDKHQCVERFTRPATDLFNFRPSDLGRPLGEITHRLETGDLPGDIDDVIEASEPVKREVAGEDGRWYIMRIRPYRSVEDDVEGAVLTFVDITTRKEAEEALRASEEKFRGLAENNLVGIGFVQEGTFEYLNPRFAEIFGYGREELLGMPVEELIHAEDRDRVREKMERRLRGEADHVQYVFKGRTKEGETRFIEVYGSRVEYQGTPTIIATIIDVTDRRRLQREILHIQEEERQRMGKDLHDGVSSLLTGTRMLASTAEAQAREQDEELADQIGRIKEQLGEAGEEIRRISRGLNPVGLEEGGLAEALERLTTSAGVSEESVCHFEADGPLPELSSEVATHMYWVAQEAVNNARKYAEAGELTVHLRHRDGHLELTVTDDGRGFDPQEIGEEGMGLRTMQYRAQLLGGTFDIDAAPGRGTAVRMRVPAG